MSASTWLIIAIIGFSLSGVALVIAVFMFIKMNIPYVIGDLTGKTVAREIKAIREFNNSKGDRRFRPSKVNLERGMLTENVDISAVNRKAMAEVHTSKRLDKNEPLTEQPQKITRKAIGTDSLNGFKTKSTDVLNYGSTPTEVLSNNVIEVLSENKTEVLSENTIEVKDNATTVLSVGTTVPGSIEGLDEERPVTFKITRNNVVIHTDEVI